MNRHFVGVLLIVLGLGITHTAAYQLGAWLNKPSISMALAQAAVGDRAPALVRPVAAVLSGAAAWFEKIPKQALSQCQRDFVSLGERAKQCADSLGAMANDRAKLERIAAEQRAQIDIDTVKNLQVRYALYQDDAACADWGNQPICPGLSRLRENEISGSGTHPLGRDSTDVIEPHSAAQPVPNTGQK